MNILRVLFLGDLVGQVAMRTLYTNISSLREELDAHLVAVNGENLSDGYGLLPDDVETLFSMGIGVITSGNHIWQKPAIFPILDSEPKLLRPINYPATVPGHGTTIIEVAGVPIGFINVQGQFRMGMMLNCPYKATKKALNELKKHTRNIIVDFHAEDVREKEGMFYHLDGKVTAVLGTHTHVPTADERITSKGTAVVTDLGMCGAVNGIMGIQPELSIRRALTQLPIHLETMDGPGELQGVLISLDPISGKAIDITRIQRRYQ